MAGKIGKYKGGGGEEFTTKKHVASVVFSAIQVIISASQNLFMGMEIITR
jgi:hypothetical protein